MRTVSPTSALSRIVTGTLAAIVLLTATVAVRPVAAEARTAGPSVGVQVHAMWSDMDQPTLERILDKLAGAGVGWIRVDVGWASLEQKCSGCVSGYWVDRTHAVLDAAERRGIDVMVTLWRTPDWASPSGSRIVPPTDPAEFGRFAGWFADEFGGTADAYEIWNEPNHSSYFDGTPADFVELLRAAYRPIKSADPSAPVVFGGPAYNDVPWIAEAYAAGAAGHFDVMATHPYQGMGDEVPEAPANGSIYRLTHVSAVHDLMVSHGDGDKPIWFTEFGWTSRGRTPGLANYERGVTEDEQADYLVRALDLISERYPYVENVFWYNARERDSGKEFHDRRGLLRRDLSPKPAFTALAERLNGGEGVRTGSSAAQRSNDPATQRACAEVGDTGTFSDLTSGVHGANVDCMFSWGVIRGSDGVGGRFRINDQADRGFIAAVIDRLIAAAGNPLPHAQPDRFSDTAGHPHAEAIARVAEAGISTGFGDGTYRPGQSLTRAQMATLLAATYRHLGYEVPADVADAFTDDEGSVHEANIDLAAVLSIASGTSTTTFSPGATLTRGQLTTFAARVADHAAANGARPTA